MEIMEQLLVKAEIVEVTDADIEWATNAEWIQNAQKNAYFKNSDRKESGLVKSNGELGCIGEVIAYRILQRLGIPCDEPDFSVKRGDIWDHDLVCHQNLILTRGGKSIDMGNCVSVKTQHLWMARKLTRNSNNTRKFAHSWICQRKYKNRRQDPMILCDDPKLFLGITLDLDSNPSKAVVYAFCWSDIHKYLDSPVINKFDDDKKAIYLNDVYEHQISLSDISIAAYV